MDKLALCVIFFAGALSVFVLFENKPRSGLPTWLAVPLEVASAVRTLTVHRAFVQEFESWVGMPILMFGAAVPAMAAWGFLKWASPGALASYIPHVFSGDSMLTHRCQRSLRMQPCPPNFAYKHLSDPCELQIPVQFSQLEL